MNQNQEECIKIVKRIEFIRNVIMDWRTRVRWELSKDPLFDRYGLTYGFVGLLDYLKTGNLNDIKEPYLKNLVEVQLPRLKEGS